MLLSKHHGKCGSNSEMKTNFVCTRKRGQRSASRERTIPSNALRLPSMKDLQDGSYYRRTRADRATLDAPA
jgi:hypothetical protein